MKGEPGTEVILIEVLNQSLSKKIIMDFVNSGNPRLSEAAFERAESSGYRFPDFRLAGSSMGSHVRLW